MLKKIYQELVEIRKELQAIKSSYIERKGVIPLLPECEVSWSGEPGTLGHTEKGNISAFVTVYLGPERKVG